MDLKLSPLDWTVALYPIWHGDYLPLYLYLDPVWHVNQQTSTGTGDITSIRIADNQITEPNRNLTPAFKPQIRPTLRVDVHAAVTFTDNVAADGVRAAHAVGIKAGESGAATGLGFLRSVWGNEAQKRALGT